MNKELEALQDMLEYLLCYDEFNEERHKNNANIIESALKRLALFDDENVVAYLSRSDEKKLKALEIIKEKRVDTISLYVCFEKYDLKIFNMSVDCARGEKPLTQEEYDLLKEVLKDEQRVRSIRKN